MKIFHCVGHGESLQIVVIEQGVQYGADLLCFASVLTGCELNFSRDTTEQMPNRVMFRMGNFVQHNQPDIVAASVHIVNTVLNLCQLRLL
ncbi:MAG: hypothetical protein D3913_10295 [Candidatus Electrothrix sp. LOE1_4_5]|nr:hypothetical protein [Candidatus Electrothrix gigas]